MQVSYKLISYLLSQDISHACKMYLVLASSLVEDVNTKEFVGLWVRKHFANETGRRIENILLEKGFVEKTNKISKFGGHTILRLNIPNKYLFDRVPYV